MAKMVGVWMYVAPRRPTDDVNLTGAATIILTEADRRKLGDGLMTVSLRVMDDDTFSDDTVYKDDSFQLGPALLNIGPNTFGLNAIVPRSKVANSEPGWESSAELYFRVRASGSGVTTNWANSQTESVPYE
ncbi:hypothetical protein [Microvirga subterranea]|uniref:Uncharacterized protein n=1 Tax=Microvirga subterranea TaxID=186651 RepID=A0A370HJ36_9HYPH|nr:hypothetical protein [Microvirga subterranea]RDI57975.1 hypothetical protein DES45_106289 [Microvirga subterranea]